MQTTIVRSYSAIVVAVFFTGVTGWVLMEDVVRHGAPITTKHIMTAAVLLGTIYFGHSAGAEFRAFRLKNAIGASLLVAAGTLTCVLMSAGRNAEAVDAKALSAVAANSDRDSAKTDRDEAKARYLAALKAEEGECASGQGAKCKAKRETTALRRHDLDVAEIVLRDMPPLQRANGDIHAAAVLISRIPYVTASVDGIEASLTIAYPFLLSLFCEIAAIIGFSMGLGHKKRELPALLPPIPLQSSVAPTVTTVSEPDVEADWVPVSVTKARMLARQAKAEELFDALRAQSPLSNDELASRLSIHKGECSRRVSALEDADLVRRQRVGRYVAITLRPLTA